MSKRRMAIKIKRRRRKTRRKRIYRNQ